MVSFAALVLRNANPFDNIYTINQQKNIVDYIYQEEFIRVERKFNEVIQNNCTYTVLIHGNYRAGNNYFLAKIYEQFNYKSLFVYIPPFPQREVIWRHILRYVVDTLVITSNHQFNKNNKNNQKNKKESQLLKWLSNFKQDIKYDLFDFLRSDKNKFINKMKEIYKGVKIYNSDTFFSILYDLTNAELYPLACEYLRGDDLSQESLEVLGVEKSIETETLARETLANLSRIVSNLQPMVLCFDKLANIGRLPDETLDLPALFTVNTKIREENINILVIFNINNYLWKENKDKISQLDKHNIDEIVSLKYISFLQAELLIESKLKELHNQDVVQVPSSIYPFNRAILEQQFPEGKINPRDLLIYARSAFQSYKIWLTKGGEKGNFVFPQRHDNKAVNFGEIESYFRVIWCEEFLKVQENITKLRQLSSPELIRILEEILIVLQVDKIINPLFVRTKYASYSLGYQLINNSAVLGFTWMEDPHLTSFLHLMEACEKTIEKNKSLKLFLIRAESLGNKNDQGYKIYHKIFVNSFHSHVIPDLTSIHYLATYNNLLQSACAGDLIIAGKVIDFQDLRYLMYKSNIFNNCVLLEKLGLVVNSYELYDQKSADQRLPEYKKYIFDLVKSQICLSTLVVIQKTCCSFPELSESKVEALIQQLCWEKKLRIIDPKASIDCQLVCLAKKTT